MRAQHVFTIATLRIISMRNKMEFATAVQMATSPRSYCVGRTVRKVLTPWHVAGTQRFGEYSSSWASQYPSKSRITPPAILQRANSGHHGPPAALDRADRACRCHIRCCSLSKIGTLPSTVWSPPQPRMQCYGLCDTH